MRALVPDGTEFIGPYLVENLLAEGVAAVGVDTFNTSLNFDPATAPAEGLPVKYELLDEMAALSWNG